MVKPDVQQGLRQLIESALSESYTSTSCKDGIQTGNHYQSVTLGDEKTAGFRGARAEFLDQLNLAHKKVLDLGSNLGELSRAARAKGARYVDGFEYDPFFIELANMVNALNATTRVSFFQRDITDRAIYTEDYDVTFAFSVFTYVADVLDVLAARTKEVLIIETHKLEDNLERSYIDPVTKYLPHYRILGESDWGSTFAEPGVRAVIAFASDEAKLHNVLLSNR